jgi:hypothetical protein
LAFSWTHNSTQTDLRPAAGTPPLTPKMGAWTGVSPFGLTLARM